MRLLELMVPNLVSDAGDEETAQLVLEFVQTEEPEKSGRNGFPATPENEPAVAVNIRPRIS